MKEEGGGRTWARTKDPLIKSQLLYQLSYASTLPFRCDPKIVPVRREGPFSGSGADEKRFFALRRFFFSSGRWGGGASGCRP